MIYIKVTWNDDPDSYILDLDDDLLEEIEDLKCGYVGKQLVLTVVEMSVEKFDALPDRSDELS